MIFSEAERRAWEPPEEISFWDWLGKYFVLTKEFSDVTGLYPRELVPALKPIALWLDDPEVEEVICRKSTQIGLTTMIVGWFLKNQHLNPGPDLFAMADQATAEEMAKFRFKPAFEAAHCFENVKVVVTDEFVKLSNGGHIKMAWGSSVSKFASSSVARYAADEITKPGYSLKTKEGNSIRRLRYRGKNTEGRKGIITSTVTGDGDQMHILEKESDCVYRPYVPCPECGEKQPLFFFRGNEYFGVDGQMKKGGFVHFESDDDLDKYRRAESARYCCGNCGALWTNEQKNAMMQLCEPLPDRLVSRQGARRFYHIWRIHEVRNAGSLYSIVLEFLESKDSPEKLRSFYNNALGEYFREILKTPTESTVAAARADYLTGQVPEAALALIATVDVQKFGFWYLVRAWSNTETSWKIEHGFVQTENQLNQVLFEKTWPSPHGPMRIWRVGIDTGGSRTESGESSTEWVYRWYFQNLSRGTQLFLTKGYSGSLPSEFRLGKPIFTSPKGRKLPQALRLILIDTNKTKDLFFWRINQTKEETPVCPAYIPSDEKKEYFQQIESEHKIKEGKIEVWKQRGQAQNHLLDCEQMQQVIASRDLFGGVFMLTEPVGTVSPIQEPEPVTVQNNQSENPYLRRRK